MKRGTKPMKRTRLGRGKRLSNTLGRGGRSVQSTGQRGAKGRESLNVASWRALVGKLTERAEGRCESRAGRKRGRLAPHHVVKRSQGGPDTEFNVIMLCRPCHESTDFPTGRGRLMIAAFSEVDKEPVQTRPSLPRFEGSTLTLARQTGFIFFAENGAETKVILWPTAES